MALSKSEITSTVVSSIHFAGYTIETLPMWEDVGINHSGCTAGVDLRKRLFVKREANKITWYCHHCGTGGYIRDVYAAKIKSSLAVCEPKYSEKKVAKADDLTLISLSDLNVPPDVRKYLENYLGYNYTSIELPFKYSIAPAGIFYPMPNGGGQIRLLPGNPKGPKYITYRGDPHPCPYSALGETQMTRLFVFTEDYLSAYLVSQHLWCAAIPLYGAHFSVRTFYEWYKQRDRANKNFLVWLDNDSDTIKAKAEAMARDLQVVVKPGTEVYLHQGGIEPKKLFSDEREKVLRNYMGENYAA